MYIRYEFIVQLRSVLFDTKSFLSISVTRRQSYSSVEAFQDVINRVNTCELKEDEMIVQINLKRRRLMDSDGNIIATCNYDTQD